MATCPAIIIPRERAKGERSAPPIGAIPSSDSVSTRFSRRVCHAGNSPHAILAATETASANASMRMSIVTASSRGKPAGSSRGSNRRSPAASAKPAVPPPSPTIAFSTSNCLTMRRCPAPMAARTAISRRRVVARASCKLATLAVAVISRRATAASRTRTAGRTSAVIASSSGTAETLIGPTAPNSALATTPISGALRARKVASAAA